jgi:predicted flap endonuclease-1-like 5' DNA nuclease
LLKVCATERGRKHLANEIGVPQSMLLKWVYRGDLLRVRGVGRKYATLLESAGVNTVSDLSTRNPRHLFQTLRTVNREKRLVRRTPPSKTIEIWVNIAGTLEPVIEQS